MSVRILMNEIIDYAGLFPPASLDMPGAVERWAQYQRSPHAWILGRLIIPAARLDEFQSIMREREDFPATDPEPWRISALVALDTLDAQIDRIFEFNHALECATSTVGDARDSQSQNAESPSPAAQTFGGVDTIELKVSEPVDVDRAMRIIPEQIDPYFEIAPDQDIRGFVTAIAGTGGRAKIRTGSVRASEIPTPERVASFISACAAADVPFKATAGLHHPIRAEYPLTYDADPPRGTMFGFLNVFLAAAFARTSRMNADELQAVLEESDANAFAFDDKTVRWRSHELSTSQLARARESFAVSFGSCSFEEPVADLQKLHLLT